MRRSLTLFFAMVIGLASLKAQIWNPVGSGFPTFPTTWDPVKNGIASYEYNGEIYVAYNEFNSATNEKQAWVKKWDGLTWQTLPPIPDYHVYDMVVDANSIYLVGGNNVGPKNFAFYEFDGNTWTSKGPSGYDDWSTSIEIVNGDIMIGGPFTANGGIEKVLSYDGSNYTAYPALTSGANFVHDFHVFNGDLYLGLATHGMSLYGGLGKWDGTNWSNPAYHDVGLTGVVISSGFSHVFDFQNELYVARDAAYGSQIFRVYNDTLFFIDSLNHTINDVKEYNGEIYLGGITTTGTSDHLSIFDGSIVTSVFNAPEVHAMEVLNSELYVFSATSDSLNGLPYYHAYRTQANFSALKGEVYLDLNNDCFKNGTDIPIPNAIISLNNQMTTTSRQDGHYSMFLSPGTYSFGLSYIPDRAHKNLVSSCNLPVQLTLGLNQTLTQNIALQSSVPTDMLVEISAYRGWTARYGFDEMYKVDVTNAGNTTLTNATLELEIPSSLNFVSSSPVPATTVNNILSYNFLNIEPWQTRSIILKVNVDTAQNSLGDTVCWLAGFSPSIAGDADPTDNRDTLKQIIVGAYDPNDKHARDETIQIGTTSIDYHINFQNTGNDTAYKVTVVDTLDVTLPVNSVMINSSSHAYSISVVNNVLIWEFDNILLPDSGINYYGSMGYINFSVNINPGLAVGDTIENQAQIYFDYQHPIHTNLAKTALVQPISIREHRWNQTLNVYPNPAREFIYIENDGQDKRTLKLLDLNGRQIDEIDLNPGQKTTYPIHQLQKGVYLIGGDHEFFRLEIM